MPPKLIPWRILFLITVVVGLISFCVISMVQCSSLGKTAAQHEEEVLSKCQLVTNSRYIDCLKREWDHIHNKESKR